MSPLLDAATSTDPLPLDSVVVTSGEDLEDDDDMELKVEVGEVEDELGNMTTSGQGKIYLLFSNVFTPIIMLVFFIKQRTEQNSVM